MGWLGEQTPFPAKPDCAACAAARDEALVVHLTLEGPVVGMPAAKWVPEVYLLVEERFHARFTASKIKPWVPLWEVSDFSLLQIMGSRAAPWLASWWWRPVAEAAKPFPGCKESVHWGVMQEYRRATSSGTGRLVLLPLGRKMFDRLAVEREFAS